MAASFNRLRTLALRNTRQIPSRRKPLFPTCFLRPLHTTPLCRHPSDDQTSSIKFDPSTLDPADREEYALLSPDGKNKYEEEYIALAEHMSSPAVRDELNADVAAAAYEVQQQYGSEDERPERIKPGLMAMGEVDEQGTGEDEEFEGDDISSLGHGELEQHREKREYARIAAWEMPLLSKLAKPFEPPSSVTPLRFRYTTYLGETHPAARKIVLEFCTADLPSMTPAQRTKLIKLVGPRYNPETDVIKMSSEMFETQAQNKRYLGDLVDTLLAEARNEEDMFEDVPLDFRHHKFKRKVVFPEGWKLTGERKMELEGERQRRVLLEERMQSLGRVVDGKMVIGEGMKNLPRREESKVLLQAQQGRGGARATKAKVRR